MARIAAGFATSFSPQLHVPPELWPAMGDRDSSATALLGPDGRQHTYYQLLAMAGPSVAQAITPEEQAARHKTCQDAIALVARKVQGAGLDALIVFTDDERQLFDDDAFPSLFLYHGDTVPYVPRPIAATAAPQTKAAAWAYGSQTANLPGSPKLGGHILQRLPAAGYDVTRSRGLKEGTGIGHHIGFVNTRLLEGKTVPLLPVLFNASFPPNVLTTSRLYGFGRAIAEAVAAWPEAARVGVLAVGGLSHPVIDEELDRTLLQACRTKDAETLASLPEERLSGGNGQGRVWIAAAGALHELTMHLVEYVPAYRSPGGTGCGMAFAYWE
jgi:3-O-methylgallate 3,4-dioxygenase